MNYYNKYIKYINKSGYNYFIDNIQNINDKILAEIDKNQSECWNITDINSGFNRKNSNYDVLCILENNNIIFSTYINVYKKHNYVYLNSICSSKEYRGKGLLKHAINFITEHYKKLGFSSIKLNADNTKNELDQKKRIEIFHKVGFTIDPEFEHWDTKNNYTVIPTLVELNDNKIVEYNDDIKLDQINKCYKKDSDMELIEDACPMILRL